MSIPNDHIVIENQYLRCAIGRDGRNIGLVDRRTGQDYCAPEPTQPFILLTREGRTCEPVSCSYDEGQLTVRFAPEGLTVVVDVEVHPTYLVFEVAAVSDPAIVGLVLGAVRLTPSRYVSAMSGVVSDGEFSLAVRALNLQVNVGVQVDGSPGFWPVCERGYGLVGARLALVGCPSDQVRSVLQEVVRAEGLPASELGGPFALDASEVRGSYVFAPAVSEENVDAWIELAMRAGFEQIHLVGWEHSLGHYEPRADLHPRGLESLKAVVDRIHAAGLKAGMHTLTGCISPHDPWVTPVPDSRLEKDAAFTLAAPITAAADVILTVEQPEDLPTFWSYMGPGNTLQIGDEIIEYSGVSSAPPCGFTGCERGFRDTVASPHEQGAVVYHLFSIYNAYMPDESTALVDEVADRIARVFNTCGFDMIYMDGAEGMRGWHAIARMRAAIFSRLQGRALVEASCWDTHSWPFHSRIGAWDHPKHGFKRFVDLHIENLQQMQRSSLLPYQLGWWVITGPSRDFDAERPDEMEYLGAKCLGWDAPMSLQGITVGKSSVSGREDEYVVPANARQDEYLTRLGRYERLRRAGHVPESVREKLRVSGDEFRLVPSEDGAEQLIPTDYAAHKVAALDDGSSTWTVANRFGSQPARLRIQALYAVAPYDAGEGVVVADFERPEAFAEVESAGPIEVALSRSKEPGPEGGAGGCLVAESRMATRRGAWARVGTVFSPPLDLGNCGALGVWVHGDNQGEVLNLQLFNAPDQHQAWAEHYVKVDFSGWRYFEFLLREREAERFPDHVWPYDLHGVFRFPLVRSHVGGLNLYVNELPPGEPVTCGLGPIRALPALEVKLERPALTINGRQIVFPAVLESGQYIEFESPEDCVLYDQRGDVLERIVPEGDVPVLRAGANTVSFTGRGPEGYRTRASVTVISLGEALGVR